MPNSVELLKKMIVKNPKITLKPGDVCFYMANAKIGKPYDKTTVKTKTGPGIGVSVPVTKHVGIGLFRRKVTTEVKTETAWKKTPCVFYLLSNEFAFSVGRDVHYVNYDEVTGMKLNKDAVTIESRNYSFYMFMSNADVMRFKRVMQLVQQAQAEGADMKDFT